MLTKNSLSHWFYYYENTLCLDAELSLTVILHKIQQRQADKCFILSV